MTDRPKWLRMAGWWTDPKGDRAVSLAVPLGR